MTAAEIRQYVRDFKTANPCTDCGQHHPYFSMEFDHVRGEKRFNIGSAGFWSRTGNDRQQHRVPELTKAVIDREIAKCDLVCVLCHRLRKWGHLLRGPEA